MFSLNTWENSQKVNKMHINVRVMLRIIQARNRKDKLNLFSLTHKEDGQLSWFLSHLSCW